MTTAETNVQTLQTVYMAFTTGDIPTILSYLASDVHWISPYGGSAVPWGGTRNGPTEVVSFFQAIHENLEARRFEPYAYIAQGNKVVVQVHWEGIVRRSGSPFKVMLVHIWTLESGKIVECIGLDDPTAYDL